MISTWTLRRCMWEVGIWSKTHCKLKSQCCVEFAGCFFGGVRVRPLQNYVESLRIKKVSTQLYSGQPLRSHVAWKLCVDSRINLRYFASWLSCHWLSAFWSLLLATTSHVIMFNHNCCVIILDIWKLKVCWCKHESEIVCKLIVLSWT